MNKKLYIFFSLTSFAYMLSVSVYLLNSFIMLNDTIFAVTRILMICCLLIFLLFGLKLKTIAKIVLKTFLKTFKKSGKNNCKNRRE